MAQHSDKSLPKDNPKDSALLTASKSNQDDLKPILSRLVSEEWLPETHRQRPRLSYLRSAWGSQDLRAIKAKQPLSIELPRLESWPTTKEPYNGLEREINHLATIGVSLSVIGSFAVLGISLDDIILQIATGLSSVWWLIMAVLWIRSPASLEIYLKWTTHSSLVSTAITISAIVPWTTLQKSELWLWYMPLYKLAPVLASLTGLIFLYIALRLDWVSSQTATRLRLHLEQEHDRLQTVVCDAVEEELCTRQTFLSTVSQEIQDAALMIITTLEQFSPASILSNTYELLSACSIAVPIASISAINTSVKQVCHVSSHLELVARLLREGSTSSAGDSIQSLVRQEFDIGDMVQNVGDALAGMASKLDVKLVIYHADNGLHHTHVVGDEGAMRHALLDLLHNILEGCTPGACIELGLNITTAATDRFKIAFEITHTTSPAIPNGLTTACLPNANLTARLLHYIGASLSVDDISLKKTRFDVVLEMEAGHEDHSHKPLFLKNAFSASQKHYSTIKFSNEPTLKELCRFIENLRGLKIVLHASEQSVFSKHLTSCLASWNTDISHVPIDYSEGPEDDWSMSGVSGDDITPGSEISQRSTAPITPLPGTASFEANIHTPPLQPQPQSSSLPPQARPTPPIPTPAIEEEHLHSLPPAFILIDDDILTLERKLHEFRTQPPASANTLQNHQNIRRHKRNKSSNHPSQNFFHQGTTAIIHFTSLTNYKRVRDSVQFFSSSTHQLPFSMPRVVVVPKPAGPRRFLTALHTAWNNAVVEPHFLPIATSPSSPCPPTFGMTQMRENNPGGSSPVTNLCDSERTGQLRSSPGESVIRRRPGSGVFSPPPTASDSNAHEASYFFDSGMASNVSGMACIAANVPSGVPLGSPVLGATLGSVRNLGPTRRRSHAELNASGSSPSATGNSISGVTPSDYLTSGGSPATLANLVHGHGHGHTPFGQGSSPVNSPLKVQYNNPAANSPEKKHPDHALRTGVLSSPDEPNNQKCPQAAGLPSQPLKDQAKSPLACDGHPLTPNETSSTAKKPMRANIKLNKKRRKERSAMSESVVNPPINVLIVEDNIINQAILSAWMKKHRIKFSVASNGQEAVEKWKQGGFHLVLMDIQLPVMDGIQATKTIRAIEKEQKIGVLPMSSSFLRQQQLRQSTSGTTAATTTANSSTMSLDITDEAETLVPFDITKNGEELPPSTFRSPVIIVALTASSLESDRHAALAAGCNDFLTKPVSLEWLEKKIVEWGCMQALIDFEGWRQWKQSSTTDATVRTLQITPKKESDVAEENAKNTDTKARQKDEEEKRRIAELSRAALLSGKGVLLPGAVGLTKARRFSTLDRNGSTGSSYGSRRGHPMMMPKGGSDSNLLAGVQNSREGWQIRDNIDRKVIMSTVEE
ncbi:hypothetical protein CLU79DRAFT_817193 [Phycomyces nitens]|nr:hypothetical protein CLU79DRAFT_817193 [Phycomyces nitens]